MNRSPNQDLQITRRPSALRFPLFFLCAVLVGLGTLTTPPLGAQSLELDEDCVVSLLNRSTPVSALGTWALPDLRSSLGAVRARATCVRDGVTTSGRTAPFLLQTDEAVEAPPIFLVDPGQTPLALEVSANIARLSATQPSVQLDVLASFADGTTLGVAAAAAGTTYTVSNPALISVDANGLATAQISGRVIVSVLHDGAVGLLTLEAVLAEDSDGDGIPDDLELANGLQPNDPIDGLEDLDGDGLTNRRELIDLGTDVRADDSDGDGLTDGQEVDIFGTQPLLAESDGDGVSDGLEVLVGSDPLDPQSVDLAGLLTSISVQPSNFVIVFNTLLAEASQRLRVVGTLVDGTNLDITNPIYGTTFASSDLLVANFDGEPGRVFGGQGGLATITAANNGFSVPAFASVETFSPSPLSALFLPLFPNSIDLLGDFALIAGGREGLMLIDISDPQNPLRGPLTPTPGNAFDVRGVRRPEGDFAFIADDDQGVAVIDLNDPAAPFVVGQTAVDGVATDLVVQDDRLYLANALGLRILDITDVTNPRLLGGVDLEGNARGVDLYRPAGEDSLYAVVAAATGGVHIVDVTDPFAPLAVGQTHTRSDGRSRAAGVVVQGDRALVADASDLALGGIRVIDLGNPSLPAVVGATAGSDLLSVTDLAIDRQTVVVADALARNSASLFNLADDNPAILGQFSLSVDGSVSFFRGTSVATRQGLGFVVGTIQRPADNVAIGSGIFSIGRFLRPDIDTAGLPPRLEITSPLDGDTTLERLTVPVLVDAEDDIRVAAVQFFVDGELVAVDFEAPFTTDIEIPVGTQSIRLGAAAIDTAGAQTRSEDVVLEVFPNAAPVVEILSPSGKFPLTQRSVVAVSLQATDDDRIERIELRIDGVLRATLDTPPFRADLQLTSAAPQAIIEATAFDGGGQTATDQVEVSLLADRPPVVRIQTPSDGDILPAESNVSVLVAAGDDIDVSSVELFIDGELADVRDRPPYTFSIPAGPPGSQRRLQAKARAPFNQETFSEEVLVTVSTALPVVRLLAPPPEAELLIGQTVDVEAVVDNPANLRELVFLLDGEEIAASAQPPYSTQFTVPADRPQILLEAAAIGQSGGIAFVSRSFLVVSNRPPTVALLEPTAGTPLTAGADLLLRASASDEGEVTSVTVRIDGLLIAEFAAPPFDVLTTVPSGQNEIEIEIVARDDGGLETTFTQAFQVIDVQAAATRFADYCGDATHRSDFLVADAIPCLFGGEDGLDITQVEVAWGPSAMLLTLRLRNPIPADEILAVVSLDLDRDPQTGTPSIIDGLSLHAETGLGTDLEIWIDQGRSDVPVVFEPGALTLAIPVERLGAAASNGELRFAAALLRPELEDRIIMLSNPRSREPRENPEDVEERLPAGDAPHRPEPKSPEQRGIELIGIGDFRDNVVVDVVPNGGFLELPTPLDTDGDGLSDTEELIAGTDPEAFDSDFDGLGDAFEVAFGFNPVAFDDALEDPDGDTLDNITELFFGSNPFAIDSDGDSLPDGEEAGDGFLASLPSRFDSDADGLDDGAEFQNFLPSLIVDFDVDGLHDGEEISSFGTDPNLLDSDGSGAPDGAEVRSDGTDPLDPADDVLEIRLGSNVLNAGSGLAVGTDGTFHLAWIDPAGSPGNQTGRVFYSQVATDGTLLIAPTQVLDTPRATTPRLLLDAIGRVHLLWSAELDDPQPQIFYALLDPLLDDLDGSPAGAEIFLATRKLSTSTQVASREPRAALDPLGRLHVVWVDLLAGSEIHYTRLSSSGTVEIPDQAVILGRTDLDRHLAMAVDDQASVHIVFSEDRTDGGFLPVRALHYALVNGDTGILEIAASELLEPRRADPLFPTVLIATDGRPEVVFQDRTFLFGNLNNECSDIRRLRLDPTDIERSGAATDPSALKLEDTPLLRCLSGRFSHPAAASIAEGGTAISFLTRTDFGIHLGLATFAADGSTMVSPFLVTGPVQPGTTTPTATLANNGSRIGLAFTDFATRKVMVRELFRAGIGNGTADSDE